MKIIPVVPRLFLLFGLVNASSAFAGTSIVGEGAVSCTRFTASNDVARTYRMEWVLGYLSATNLALKSEILSDTSTDKIEAAIDKYCLENPMQDLLTASAHVGRQLRMTKPTQPAPATTAHDASQAKAGLLDPTPNLSRTDPTCPSKATLKIEASGYSGMFVAELRLGQRPGSRRISGSVVSNGGAATFSNVCPGDYFFAFGPTDSDEVSITRHFTVINDGRSYSNPVITVVYTRTSEPNTNRVQKARKKDL